LLELSKSKKKGGTQYSSIIATTLMIYHKKSATLSTKKLLDEMQIQWRFTGGKSKEDKDSSNKDETALANKNKRGKTSGGGDKLKKENQNKDKTCNHCKKNGHIKITCLAKIPREETKSVKNRKSKQESKSSITTAVINDIEDEIILAAENHEEQYGYLNDEEISDNKESILKVFTREINLMDITDAYQYTPVINNIKYLDGIELLQELEDEESNKEFIGSNDEHVMFLKHLYLSL
jgi:hypothetical protein